MPTVLTYSASIRALITGKSQTSGYRKKIQCETANFFTSPSHHETFSFLPRFGEGSISSIQKHAKQLLGSQGPVLPMNWTTETGQFLDEAKCLRIVAFHQ